MTLVIVGALSDELAPIRAMMAIEANSYFKEAVIHIGKIASQPVIVAKCGVGQEAMATAMEYIISTYQPTAILSIGFAGGLSPHLHVGDLVVSDSIGSTQSDMAWSTDEALRHIMEEHLQKLSIPFQIGRIVATNKALCLPHEKAFLGTAQRALAVDMESEGLAITASRHKIPFLVVRAIFDAVETPLPQFDAGITEGGNFHPISFMGHLVKHPKDIVKLPHFRYAAESCKKNVSALIESWMKD